MQIDEIKQVISSYNAHLSHGHCYKLQNEVLRRFVIQRKDENLIEKDENKSFLHINEGESL